MKLIKMYCDLRSHINVQQIGLKGWSAEKELGLSLKIKCDQITEKVVSTR
jgi:hypothetical protein